MTSPLSVVAAFLEAWGRRDPFELTSHFTEDATYHNIPLSPVRGIVAIREHFTDLLAQMDSIEITVHRELAAHGVVMNERTDVITMTGITVALPVMGCFELAGDKISAWRDYFDLGTMIDALAAGPGHT